MSTAIITRVTEQGVLVPKQFLEGIDQVEIRKEQNVILLVPVSEADPILEFGKHPITIELDDASINHDHYLYG
ncbi:MAG TPA: hypothetical protein VJ793_14610 [Anaerolineae bacterium]|nr:hypothetical protein [Anaerolineae bacterium]